MLLISDHDVGIGIPQAVKSWQKAQSKLQSLSECHRTHHPAYHHSQAAYCPLFPLTIRLY